MELSARPRRPRSRTPRWSRWAASIAGLPLALAGCDAAAPAPAPVPSSPAAPPSSPTARAEPTRTARPPTAPALPTAARQASEAGARAFIDYYWALVNYAQATGDVRQLRKASGPHCRGCSAGISGIVDLYQGGGNAEGGTYGTHVTKIEVLKSKAFYSFEALVRVVNQEQVITNADGTRRTSAPSNSLFAVVVIWTKEHWRMDYMEAR